MNYLVPNATGIDYIIQNTQVPLYKKLQAVWGVTDQSYNCFGRALRNPSDKGYIPEFWDSTKGCNVDSAGESTKGGLFFDDRFSAISFFEAVDPFKKNTGAGIVDTMVKVQLIFCIDLKKITPGGLNTLQQGGQRLDEVAINDVKNFLMLNGGYFNMRDVYRNVEKVFERYSGIAKNRALLDSIDNKLCFRIDLEVPYDTVVTS